VTRVLLVGYGRMGRLIESLAGEYDCEIAGVVDPLAGKQTIEAGSQVPGIDVAIDFTTAAAVMTNVPALTRQKINIVLGTTGWSAHEADLRKIVADAGIGIVAAPNFSTGVVLFEAIVAHAAGLFATQEEFGAFLHEAHHAAKKDAPSGTALLLKQSMERAGYGRTIDVSSARVGHVPGTHTIGFDGPAETITLTHTARDRSAFARGALAAARWVNGRRGWFTMKDVLGVHQ
jgi:4-hydroxy-tetrahydrodipicolinate reductase